MSPSKHRAISLKVWSQSGTGLLACCCLLTTTPKPSTCGPQAASLRRCSQGKPSLQVNVDLVSCLTHCDTSYKRTSSEPDWVTQSVNMAHRSESYVHPANISAQSSAQSVSASNIPIAPICIYSWSCACDCSVEIALRGTQDEQRPCLS